MPQALLIVSALALSWLTAMAIHEFGHVVGAWITGGRVERVVLHPLTISRTDVSPNPRPLIVAWMGPIIGVLLPVAGLAVVWPASRVARDLMRFFAGACLVGNGLYLGIGVFGRVGDAGDLLRHGADAWHLWLFAALTVPLGFALWNGIGPTFGLGRAQGKVSRIAAYVCAAIAVAAYIAAFLLSPDE